MYCDACYRTGLPLTRCCESERCPACHRRHQDTDHAEARNLAARTTVPGTAARAA